MFNNRFFKKNLSALLLIFSLLLIISCGQVQRDNAQKDESFFDSEVYSEYTHIEIDISDINEIFYDMYSPIEAQRLFKQINLVFDPSILNPPDDIMRYSSSVTK